MAHACGQAVDLATNVSSFSFTPATVTIDTTAPGVPTAQTGTTRWVNINQTDSMNYST